MRSVESATRAEHPRRNTKRAPRSQSTRSFTPPVSLRSLRMRRTQPICFASGHRRRVGRPYRRLVHHATSNTHIHYAASRCERSASPAEEYLASPWAAVDRTLRSMGEPGVITTLMPRSPRPFSLPDAATSTERQPKSMT